MAEICEVCFVQLKRWSDYEFLDYNSNILCLECQKAVEELYDKHEGKKEFKKCIKEVRKMRQKTK